MYFSEDIIVNIINDKDKYMLLDILNEYLSYIVINKDTKLETAIEENMIIGYSYPILEKKEEFEEVLLKNMNIIKNSIEKNELINFPVVDQRLLDIGYSTYFIYKNTNYLEKFLYSINKYIVNLTQKQLNYYDNNYTENFSLIIKNFSRIFNYLLEFGNMYKNELEDIIKFIINYIEQYIGGTSDNIINIKSKYVDFGLGGGIAGCLALLVKSARNRIFIKNQEKYINYLIDILEKYKINNKIGMFWSGILDSNLLYQFENFINLKENYSHGSIAIIYILYNAKRLQKSSDEKIYLNELINKSKTPIDDLVLGTPSIEEGYSGLLCLYDSINNIYESDEFLLIKNSLLKEVIKFYNNLIYPTFKKRNIYLDSTIVREKCTFNDYSIYTGNTGIILSLISCFTKVNDDFYKYLGII